MICRRPKFADMEAVEEISLKYSFPLPTEFYTAAVTEKDGKIKSFGILRWILEAIMIVDGSKREKVESLNKLIEQAIIDCSNNYQLHVFVENEEFVKILKKRYGFRNAVGTVLVLDVRK